MSNIIKIFLIVFLLHVNLNARESQEVSVFSLEVEKPVEKEQKKTIKEPVKEVYEEVFDNTNNEDEFVESQVFNPKTLFVSYKDLPVSGYVGELIPLTVRVIVTTKFDDIKIKYNNSKGKIFEFESKWRKDSDNTYEKTIYFQPNVPMESLPEFKVEIIKNGKAKESSFLKNTKLNIVKLGDDDGRFINVIAKNLIVKRFKTTQFNESTLMMVMEIQTSQASINNIKFNNVIKQGLDSKSGNFPDYTLYYFLVFNNDKSAMTFSYFNTTINQYEIINLPVIVEQDDLSTQIGLNPKKSRFELYKDIGVGVLIILLFGLFLYYRKYIYAILAIFLCIYLFYVRGTTTLTIKSGSKIRILPTEKSTIFYTISSPMQVEKLNRVDPYIKVLLPNKKIGWVKEEDVIKN